MFLKCSANIFTLNAHCKGIIEINLASQSGTGISKRNWRNAIYQILQ